MKKEVFRFIGVGILGFSVDAATFSIFVYTSHLSLIQARIIAFLCAATATWLGNRHITFQRDDAPVLQQWFRFMTVATDSALPNFICFSIANVKLGQTGIMPLLSLSIGIIAGAACNYTLCKYWVFNGNSTTR